MNIIRHSFKLKSVDTINKVSSRWFNHTSILPSQRKMSLVDVLTKPERNGHALEHRDWIGQGRSKTNSFKRYRSKIINGRKLIIEMESSSENGTLVEYEEFENYSQVRRVKEIIVETRHYYDDTPQIITFNESAKKRVAKITNLFKDGTFEMYSKYILDANSKRTYTGTEKKYWKSDEYRPLKKNKGIQDGLQKTTTVKTEVRNFSGVRQSHAFCDQMGSGVTYSRPRYNKKNLNPANSFITSEYK
ncbi:hypothetical protein BN7_6056 [Wickerhamomyces ciferrii]|uniref:Uncharacterized protein n=1 Tax=Wickerhamomyces ciferrii (strain ATCC 14091 / BCRC 22168 / CBS 111 / JCM 3599 / NBRC 0793 / NRRL Y-1031 F-60-10) TaxID=1206466 RepID=K0KZA4_WICCF|nr:uncharacterized protein BN7_6056 [Wickerhamomyces ciferrii]CCH46463.1 hypothetical protein BN7_6056 [Wickerhamomyces ciferrii]